MKSNGEAVERDVREVFQAVLGASIPAGQDLRRAEHARWDSLRHIEILFSVEERCGVKFTEEEMGTLDCFSKIVECASGNRAS